MAKQFVCAVCIIALFWNAPAAKPAPSISSATPPRQWDTLEKEIRDGTIARKVAQEEMKRLRPLLEEYFTQKGGAAASKSEWVFPVQGYTYRDIEKYFVWRGFDFFDNVRTVSKNKRSTHPAYDIIIRDVDQDLIDDITEKPVNALSMTAGVVVGKHTGWTKKSRYLGGNYVWVYDPGTEGLFYYAHLQDVFVDIGDVVAPGQKVGTIGRTGKNAYPKRSPTHLHLMYLHYPLNGYPAPKRIYNDLVRISQREVKKSKRFRIREE